MADTFDYDKLAEAMDRRSRSPSEGPNPKAAIDQLIADYKKFNTTLKDTNTKTQNFTKFWQEGTKTFKDVTKNLKELDERIESMAEGDSKRNLIATRNDVASSAASQKSSAEMFNFAVSVKSGVTGLATFAAGLIKSHDTIASDPIGSGASLINSGIDLANKGTKILTKGVAAAAATVPVFGAAVAGAAAAADAAADVIAATAKMLNDILSAELKKTATVMKDLSSQGASFAGGMTELRTISNESGLNMAAFSGIVKNSKESMQTMGLSTSEASRVLSRGLIELKTQVGSSGRALRDEMLAMGIAYEDQGPIMAQYMAGLKIAGKLETTSKEEIAAGTRAYAKDLKVLADITGKDAKKAMDEAQKKSMEADIKSKLGSKEEIEKFTASYAAMPDALKKGFLEKLSTGSVGDKATNIAMSQNSKIEEYYNNTIKNLRDFSKTTSDAQQEALTGRIAVGKAQSQVGGDLARASRMTGNFADSVAIQNELIMVGQGDPTLVRKSAEANELMAKSTDPVTTGFITASAAAMNFSVQVEKLATDALPRYAAVLDSLFTTISNTINAAGGSAKKETGNSWGRSALGFAGTAIGATVGGLGGLGVATVPGAIAGGMGGNYIGNMIADALGLSPNAPGKAQGGIASGSMSGYLEKLHGTEAVVPLPDGKTIPVAITSPLDSVSTSVSSASDTSSNMIKELLSRQLDLMQKSFDQTTDMLSSFNDSKQLQQQLVNNSY